MKIRLNWAQNGSQSKHQTIELLKNFYQDLELRKEFLDLTVQNTTYKRKH